jgi:hypothetical protein
MREFTQHGSFVRSIYHIDYDSQEKKFSLTAPGCLRDPQDHIIFSLD